MADPMRHPGHRAEVARAALAAYDRWIKDETGDMMMPFQAVGEAMSCTRWFLELMESAPATGPKATGHANAAISGLSNGQCRDVLYALALVVPGAVTSAITEAGY